MPGFMLDNGDANEQKVAKVSLKEKTLWPSACPSDNQATYRGDKWTKRASIV